MAYEIENITEQYEDLPLTNFPVSEDTYDRMSDVTVTLLPLVVQYNELYNSGDLTGAKALLEANPSLYESLFNADKYNQLRDGLIAMQRYQLNQLDVLYQKISQVALGIDDNPDPETAAVVAYSAQKVESMFEITNVVLTALDWTNEAPYTQTIKVEGMKGTYRPHIGCAGEVKNESQKKLLQKNWNYVDDIVTGDGVITAYCNFKKPTVDLPLIIKGV